MRLFLKYLYLWLVVIVISSIIGFFMNQSYQNSNIVITDMMSDPFDSYRLNDSHSTYFEKYDNVFWLLGETINGSSELDTTKRIYNITERNANEELKSPCLINCDIDFTSPDKKKDSGYRSTNKNNSIITKTILLWTWLYSKPDWAFGLGHEPFLEKCPVYNKCRTTLDRSEMGNSDAVMFFAFAITTLLNNSQRLVDMLPLRGHQDQVWVFWNDEPPRPAYGPFNTLKGLEGMFNITVTYRRDSTISLPVFHMTERYLPTEPLNKTLIMSSKNRLAAWVVSACQKSHSYRFEYVEELSKYISIDIYGACGNLSCPKDGVECFQELQKKYKFYLAFENSYCKDYITEKAYRTLQGNWVPVVLGGGNYSDSLPPHSFIDIRDFPSPKHVAEYLQYLDNNDEEYMGYLEYKRYYRVNRRQTKDAFCKICEMLHSNDTDQYEKNLDLHEWWEASGCIKKYYVPRNIHLEEKKSE